MSEPLPTNARLIGELQQQVAALEQALKDASERLLYKQQKFRETFDHAATGLAHVSVDGRWLRVNPALCDILGYSETELLGMTTRDVTHPEDIAADTELRGLLVAGTLPRYSLEKRYLRKDGQTVWGRAHVSIVRNPWGMPDYLVSVVENIDARRAAEVALMLSQRRHEIVLSAARLGVFDFFGPGDPRNYWSFWVRRHFGIDEHSALSYERFVKLIHTDDWPAVERALGQCMTVPDSRYLIEYRVIGEQDGIERWIEASGQSFYDEEQSAIRLCGTTLDFTARKSAELSVQMSEARFRMAFDNIPDVVVIYDRELRIRYINPATVRTTGLTPDAFIGKRETDIFPAELIAPWQPALHQALSEGITTSVDVALPLTTGLRHCHITCVPLPDDQGRVIEVMGITHDFTERKNAQEQALRAALHDPLTGLPNRILLFEYSTHLFDHALRQQHLGAVLFVDLDRFKQVNDLHGHAAGDQLLVQAVARLRKAVRGGDLLFRLGGDEFVVLLPEIAANGEAAQIADRLVAALAEPYIVDGLSLLSSASIGISLFPSDGADIDHLVQAADSAMYLAKQSGKNTWRFFSHSLSAVAREAIELQNRIRGALQRDEFELRLQPLLDIASGTVCAAEALLRWPAGGVGPDAFIPAAEAVGQIVPIGDWVIEQACKIYREWIDTGVPAVPIAVNVSAVQLRDRAFRSKILNTLQRYNLPPSALQLELTESTMLEDAGAAIALLAQCRTDGLKISLDDFGTGYSSLSHLARLPIDKIKIDKSFVQTIDSDEASRAITEAIVAIARRLRLDIIAEGVESPMTLREMLSLGCHQIQGHLVAAACRPGELAQMLQPTSPLVLGGSQRGLRLI